MGAHGLHAQGTHGHRVPNSTAHTASGGGGGSGATVYMQVSCIVVVIGTEVRAFNQICHGISLSTSGPSLSAVRAAGPSSSQRLYRPSQRLCVSPLGRGAMQPLQ